MVNNNKMDIEEKKKEEFTDDGIFVRSERDRKYDRSMRLWGKHGQKRIEGSSLCVLGASPSATETLKNLVLPNCGNFTLIDSKKVEDLDTTNNFFVTNDDIGKDRAIVCSELLLEMNPDVEGKGLVKDPEDIIENNIDFFKDFTIVAASELKLKYVLKLADYCYKKDIPFISINTNGFLGNVRIQIKEHLIIESHPENDRTDLYLHPKQLEVFPELKKHLENFNLNNKDTYLHAHIPYAAILHHFSTKWIKENGKLPNNYDDKELFKQTITNFTKAYVKEQRKLQPNNLGPSTEENFDEAVEFAQLAYNLYSPDQDVVEIFNDEQGDKITKNSKDFWIIVNSIKRFKEKNGGFLPLAKTIPDMTSTSDIYLELKALYRKKYDQHVDQIYKIVGEVLKELGKDTNSISKTEVEYFVSNVRNLKMIRYRSLAEEYKCVDDVDELFYPTEVVDEKDEDPDAIKSMDIHWYFAFRAAEMFRDESGKYPGPNDIEKVQKIYEKLFVDNKIDMEEHKAIKECVEEICRYEGSRLHTIGAFVGGVASQEILKVILRQYVPYNNTLVFNGMNGSCLTHAF